MVVTKVVTNEIDQFKFEEEEDEEALDRFVELSDFEGDFDRSFAVHPPGPMTTQIEKSSEEEVMTSIPRRGLRELVAGRKGSLSKDVPKNQLPPNPPPPPLQSPLGLFPNPNLQKKKRKGKEREEGKVSPLKGPKQQKVEKSLEALKDEKTELSKKLTAVDRARLSAKSFLKSAETQAEEQRQQLHLTEIKLATQRQLVLDQKELVRTDSELREAENIFFPEDIQEIPITLPPPEQVSTTQAPPPSVEIAIKGPKRVKRFSHQRRPKIPWTP
ncbi:hypothetical protein SO802_017789 [Lithocarpus litseifolius]|uniref:Uncharacterized protein n=1 Tax=Lithocarpus litseifolius TaxID=425828 RepID=A0AAW2CKL4_9ROSI